MVNKLKPEEQKKFLEKVIKIFFLMKFLAYNQSPPINIIFHKYKLFSKKENSNIEYKEKNGFEENKLITETYDCCDPEGKNKIIDEILTVKRSFVNFQK